MAKDEKKCCEATKQWSPLGTKYEVQEDNTLIVTPPTGWDYVGYDTKDKLARLAGGATKVSCKCTGSGTCSPFVASHLFGNASGCSGSCTECNMKVTNAVSALEFSTGGYLNMIQKTEFVGEGEQIPAAFTAMFELEEVSREINEFLGKIYCGLPTPNIIQKEDYVIAPKGFSFALLNVFGRAVAVPVPTTVLEQSNKMAAAGGSANTASCSCTSGTCTLKSGSIGVASATWCQADNCTGTCTLSTGAAVINGAMRTLQTSISYKF